MIVETLQDFVFNSDYEKSFLVESNYLVYGIVVTYIVFTKFLGPSIMKQRKALDLYYFVILFNIVLGIFNAYLCLATSELVLKYWHTRCYVKYNPDFRSHKREFGHIAWHGLLLKILELVDTVIFILRKKFNQVSFLHVFHHSSIVVLYWTILKRKELAYHVAVAGAIICGVHVLTYLYYGLSAIGPGVRKYLWWKKYLTMIQILQFIVLLVYLAYSYLTDCDEFGVFEKYAFALTSAVCILYFNFYFKSYSKTK